MAGFRGDVAMPLFAPFLERGGKSDHLEMLDESHELSPAKPHKA